jgi:hypothetical protein
LQTVLLALSILIFFVTFQGLFAYNNVKEIYIEIKRYERRSHEIRQDYFNYGSRSFCRAEP